MNWNRDWPRVMMHIPAGLALVFCTWVLPVCGQAFILAWLVYELNEDMHLKDRAYIDVHGLLVGLVVGCAGLKLL